MQTKTSSTKAQKRFHHFFASILMKYKWLRITLLILILLIIIVVGLGSASFTASRIVRLGLRDIGELTTQVGYFTNVQVIENSKELYGWTIPLTTSKYIFSYDGAVKAGIDFGQIKVNTNEITKEIKVTLPDAEIFSLDIDTDSLEIYDESKSIFTPLKLTDVNDSLSDLKEEVRKQAIANGIIENAYANSKLLVENMLSKSYNTNEYSIVFSN